MFLFLTFSATVLSATTWTADHTSNTADPLAEQLERQVHLAIEAADVKLWNDERSSRHRRDILVRRQHNSLCLEKWKTIDTKTYIENHVCENLRDGLEKSGLCDGRYGNCISCKAADNPSMPKHRTFLECQVNSYATTEDICSPDGLDQHCPVMWDYYGLNSFSTCPSVDASFKEHLDVDKTGNCCKQKINRNQKLVCQAMMNTHVMYDDNFMTSNPEKKAFKAESLSILVAFEHCKPGTRSYCYNPTENYYQTHVQSFTPKKCCASLAWN